MVDNRLITNHLQERKTELRSLIEVAGYQSYFKRNESLYHALALHEKRWLAFNNGPFNAVQIYKILYY